MLSGACKQSIKHATMHEAQQVNEYKLLYKKLAPKSIETLNENKMSIILKLLQF